MALGNRRSAERLSTNHVIVQMGTLRCGGNWSEEAELGQGTMTTYAPMGSHARWLMFR